MLKKILACSAVASLCMTGAYAGVYVQGEGGYAQQAYESWGILNESVHQSHVGGGVAIGGVYPVAPHLNLGAQAGYDYYGKSTFRFNDGVGDSAAATVGVQTVDVLGIAQVPVGQFNLQGGAGAAFESNNIHIDANIPTVHLNGTYHTTKVSTRPEAMVGASYNVTHNLAAGVEYKHVFGESVGSDAWINADGKKTAVNAVLATLSYTF